MAAPLWAVTVMVITVGVPVGGMVRFADALPLVIGAAGPLSCAICNVAALSVAVGVTVKAPVPEGTDTA